MASMGPQLYRCGNAFTDMKGWVDDTEASMGPQLYRCGNFVHGLGYDAGYGASMGPQLYRCGNNKCVVVGPGAVFASMGPQLYRCGNAEILAHMIHTLSVASMGPQLYRCGNVPPRPMIHCVYFSLQWGRNFIVAEMRTAACGLVDARQASMGPQLYRCGNLYQRV